ncbi:MAG: SAM-dependent methyltransferase [Alphaproteobacteria bacterium]
MTLKEHLARLILLDGPQRISSLMELALAHPREGYYAARAAIGADGDFVTAPEISQAFGEVLGAFVLQTWLDMGEPKAWALVELGPGRGTLMLDMLRTLRLRPRALEGLELLLVEASPLLAEEQRSCLAGSGVRAGWTNDLALPTCRSSSSQTSLMRSHLATPAPERWFERRASRAKMPKARFRTRVLAGPTSFGVDRLSNRAAS